MRIPEVRGGTGHKPDEALGTEIGLSRGRNIHEWTPSWEIENQVLIFVSCASKIS
jgi:hypothetical protein